MKNKGPHFIIDKPSKTIDVTVFFKAPLQMVWDYFTVKGNLDEWWAPKPWISKTLKMDFIENGERFYAMISPEGTAHHALQRFQHIQPLKSYEMLNAFAEPSGEPILPGSDWIFNFSAEKNGTKLDIKIYNESRERMEEQLDMGFQGGFTMTLKALQELLVKKDY